MATQINVNNLFASNSGGAQASLEQGYSTAFFQKIKLSTLVLLVAMIAGGCGGGDVSSFEDETIESTAANGINQDGDVTVSDPGSDPVSDAQAGLLPNIVMAERQFADTNVLVTLSGEITAAEGATITDVAWRQLSGTSVLIPDPFALENQIVVPDLNVEEELIFQLVAQDDQLRVNSATTSVVVQPNNALLKVVGDAVAESASEVIFTVELAAAQEFDVVVSYETRAGSADADIDFLNMMGDLTFSAGETEKSLSVPVLNNDPEELSEHFSLHVSAFIGDVYAANAGVALIQNTPSLIPDEQNIAFTDAGPITLTVGEIAQNIITDASAPGSGLLAYTSSDEAIATVDEAGFVTAIATGSAEVMATKQADAVYPFSVTTYVVNVVEAEAPPALLSEDTPISLTVNTAMAPVEFVNVGAGTLQTCSADPLFEGLSINITEDGNSCELSGTPLTIEPIITVNITATNAGGDSVASIDIEVLTDLVAPELEAPVGVQTFIEGAAIDPIVFTNNGGGELTDCTAVNLVAGLEVAVNATGNTCEISGTPSAVDEAEVTITAVNAVGESEVLLPVVVEAQLQPPLLQDFSGVNVSNLPLTEGVQINPVEQIPNFGGGQLTRCVSEGEPPGVTVNVRADGGTCVISGTPLEPQASAPILITAINNAGQSEFTVNVTVEAALPIPELNFPILAEARLGPDITFFTFVPVSLSLFDPSPWVFVNNGGGELTECTTVDPLPEGIELTVSADRTTCVFSGEPTTVQGAEDVVVIATNGSGSSRLGMTITIDVGAE
ncbi:Calx-beta domain-containing protein [Marinibactrum halimedae]|uniref:Calx-beta domain-containing protein n=1 Tax=Marinibactrum halimedae TaxID=1444977 RepID=A0AA37T7V1_9GAMM|nr:Calx-beta domain-containing protein [Marinibactrum halimedae]MCD9459178.1 Ig-like domain-containing protein [Marinibactrum halimedae]GLS27249.1 hypothetical protein GCM10007877_29680 [Marinibactrum halimedae]